MDKYQIYGNLISIEPSSFEGPPSHRRWFFFCACSRTHEAVAHAVKGGLITQCSHCRRKQQGKAASITKTKLDSKGIPVTSHVYYTVWKDMRDRCNNPNSESYHNYGDRGISVCERWSGRDGALHFIQDLGPKPTLEHTIERIDNNGNYEPLNCCWATRKEQANNRRR